jgi:hypothetical protein
MENLSAAMTLVSLDSQLRIIRDDLIGLQLFPSDPGERTFSGQAGMSQRCQDRNFVAGWPYQ